MFKYTTTRHQIFEANKVLLLADLPTRENNAPQKFSHILYQELMSAEGAKERATVHVARVPNSNYDWFP